MKTQSLAKTLPFYYLGIVSIGIFAYTAYQQSAVFQIVGSKDTSYAAESATKNTYKANLSINQDGSTISRSSGNVWFGNGQNANASYLGLTFPNVTFPTSSSISNAYLEFTSSEDAWIGISAQIKATTDQSPLGNSLSSTPTTNASAIYKQDVKWIKDRTYPITGLTPVITEIAAPGSQKTVTIIIKGVGGTWARKSIYGATSDKGPRLVIETTTAVAQNPATTAPVVTPHTSHIAQPTATPRNTQSTPSITQPPSIPTPPSIQSGTLSHAIGLWSPSRTDTCTKQQHDAYSVVGPDGKRYPTWHPPTGPGGCTFGHEHGRDPSKYAYWDEIRNHFAYDANKNGTIEATELATAGIPFGYVNEQMDMQQPATMMRHEDHVGHKVEYANGEGDLGQAKADAFDANLTGGVVMPINGTGGVKWTASGVRCYVFHKVHQGVSTPDALTNNLHEAIMHEKCVSTRNDFPNSTSLLSGMIQFGASGEFNRLCISAGGPRTEIVKIGKSAANQNYPGRSNEGSRGILTQECIDKKAPDFPYEIWSGQLEISRAGGQRIAITEGGWEVLDAIRYYNPASPNLISYTVNALRPGSNVLFDDRRSPFKGVHRGQYFSAHRLFNSGGSQVLYTDVFGAKGQPTPFPGSVKQYISAVNADMIGISRLSIQPRIVQRFHETAGDSVHAPN